MSGFDVVIPHVARNDALFARTLPFIRKNLGADRIFVLAARDTVEALRKAGLEGIELVDEDAVLPGLTLERVRERVAAMGVPARRAGWYFQQFLKMAWALVPDCAERYLVWDSDTFPLRPIRFTDAGGRPVFLTSDQYHAPYFETMNELVGIGRIAERSFIAESMLFERELMLQLLDDISRRGAVNTERFFERVLSVVAASSDPYTAFSEFETYGNYALARRPGRYALRSSRGYRNGAKFYGLEPNRFDLARLAWRHDIASFERWNTMFRPFIAMQKAISFALYPLTRGKA